MLIGRWVLVALWLSGCVGPGCEETVKRQRVEQGQVVLYCQR